MAKILGLDLGTNSIGWALIDDKLNKIIGMGSRIFPVGVDNLGDGEGELSKNASRTGTRGTRRQFFRKKLRKKVLLKELASLNMCPLADEDFNNWKITKKFPTQELASWFALIPYELRHKALNEKLSFEEIGRVFYHLIQRRGFLSNSRSAGKDDGTIFKGNAKEGKIGIDETREQIENKTLGSYFYEIAPKENQPFVNGLERIRNRYTTRQMYVDEFEEIWEHQKKYHSNLTHEIKERIGGRKNEEGFKEDGILFHQRPLRSQKHLVGNCTFESGKTKCQLSAIPFELYRLHQWINTVEYNGHKLHADERKSVFNFLIEKEKPSFKDIRKAINKLDTIYKFNYKDEDKIVGTHTISNLCSKKFFGKKWFDFTEKEQEDIWHVLYFFGSKDKVKEYAIKNWGFDEIQAEAISKFNLKDKYASLSRKAINNILPFLEIGFQYDIAVVLGGIKNAYGQNWETLNTNDKGLILDNVYEIVRSNLKGGFIEPLKHFLKTDLHLSEKQLKKLYHHSANIEETVLLEKLPVNAIADKEIQGIRNPVVITALFEIRKLVNEIVDEYGKPDAIKVELARNLKASKSGRNEERKRQQKLERENDRVKIELNNLGKHISHDNLLLYKLWEECKRTCPYTGRSISVIQLFSGEVQIEHIHPWSKSLNDSFMNKTLCFADENRAKGDKTPFEFYSLQGENKWHEVKERALKLFSDTAQYPNSYQKFKRFVQQKFDDDFASKNLNDTRYISKEAKNYMSKICENVSVSPGQMTANLRQKWGLNAVLNPEDKTKTREDHRHHAIDALVMACGTVKHLQKLSEWNRYDRKPENKNFPLPWDGFVKDAEDAVDKILVSHKKLNNIITVRTHKTEKNGQVHRNIGVAARGQLHKETVFGKRNFNGEEAFHVRKPIESLATEKQIDKVVDDAIRLLILKRVQELGGFVKDKVPASTFFVVDENGINQPQIFLPNKNGATVPIKKVRIKESIGRAERLKEDINQYVNPRNNHHVLVYQDEKGNLKEDVVTFWTVVERKRQGLAVYQLPIDGKEIVTTLHTNDMFLIGLSEEEINWENLEYNILNESLYRVQKTSKKEKSFEFNFRSSVASSLDNKNQEVSIQSFKKWIEVNPIKVKISISGKISKI
jgi:CRISPR-associated endonuclease Csn1